MNSPEESGPSRYTLNLRLTSDADDGVVEPQTVYEMHSPDARAVADLLAIQQDLTFVWEACDLLLDLPSNDPALGATLGRALWSSALIAYVRCFGTGKRLGLSEDDVRQVPDGEDAVAFHRKMRDLRSKHVAHSVNPLEIIKIGIMVGSLNRDDPESVTGLVTLFSADWQPHPTNNEGLRQLAAELLPVVMERAETGAHALREAVDHLDLQEIRLWPELVYARGPVDPGTVRDH